MSDKIILNQKIKIKLTEEQEILIKKCFGMSRFYFNKCLDWVNMNYPNIMDKGFDERKTGISNKITNLSTTLFRKEYKDLVLTTPAIILNPSINRFKESLSDVLFKRGKSIKYRKKHNGKQSVTFEKKDRNTFKYNKDNNILTITRLRDVKLLYKIRYNNFDIKQVTISKHGKSYYITICMEIDKSEISQLKKTNRIVGFDWGVKTYLTGWDGSKVITFDFDQKVLDKYNRKIKLKQFKLSKKKYGSKKYLKCKEELNKAYFNKSNYIMETIKYISYQIASNYDRVIIEDLNMRDIIKSQLRFERNIRKDRPFCLLKDFLKYKLNKSDKHLFVVGKYYPSSQTCSNCGNVKKDNEKLTLNDRIYKCNKCGYEEDRDINAAKNIFMNTKIKEI